MLNVFFDISVILYFIGLFVFFFIGAVVYTIKRRKKFLTQGVSVKVKVIDEKYNGGITFGYQTTFEFKYNGEVLRKTVHTMSNYLNGKEFEALYLPDGSKNCIFVKGNGIGNDKGAKLIFITVACFIIFLGPVNMIQLESEKFFCFLAIFYIIFVIEAGYYFIVNKGNKSKSNNSKTQKLYNNIIIDKKNEKSPIKEYLAIENDENKSGGRIHINIMRVIVFMSMIIIVIGGIMVYNSYIPYSKNIAKMKKYEKGTGTIEVIFEEDEVYTSGKKKTRYEKNTVLYNYKVNHEEYMASYKSYNPIKLYEDGDDITVYYNKDNPEKSIANSENNDLILIMIFGGVFVVVGVLVFSFSIKKYNKMKREQITL